MSLKGTCAFNLYTTSLIRLYFRKDKLGCHSNKYRQLSDEVSADIQLKTQFVKFAVALCNLIGGKE